MKKLISLVLTLTFCAAVFAPAVASAASFTDLTDAHWAYDNIMRLANDGTINGYDDGTFLPEGTVTRAEFVKMLGKSDTARATAFDDVDPSHWCYDYIMYSGLDALSGNTFSPDTPIVRSDVANLLYNRYHTSDVLAPYSITSQGTNAKATAWVYVCGLMRGDDMVNLRLDDTLTRAEAATLIVRARNLNTDAAGDFISIFPDEVYERVYNGSNLFDTAYDANGTITYGELSAAALRLRFRDRALPLGNYYYTKNYEGDYAAEWDIMCNYVLEKDKHNSTEAESKSAATVADALAMLSHGASNIGLTAVKPAENGGMYADVKITDEKSSYAKNLQYAHNFGISLYAGGKLNADRAVTKKEVACIIMQYDMALGINVAYICGVEDSYKPAPLLLDTNAYPSNAADYTAILSTVPKNVYEAPFKGENVKKCKEITNTANSLASIFKIPLSTMCTVADSVDIDMNITYYPSLMAMSDKGYLYRVKVVFGSRGKSLKMSDIFNLADGVSDDPIEDGKAYWLDLATNAKLSGLYIDYSIMTLEQVID